VTLATHAPLFRPRTAARVAPVALGVATVLAQIAYPLTSGTARSGLSMLTVSLFFAASVTHALAWRGARFTAALLAVTTLGGLAVEAVGVGTGFPFGAYAYTDSLPPRILGVPWVIPLAWTMMAYPALIVGRRISASPRAGVLAAAAAFATWDLYLDPQMVDAGHWVWSGGGPALLGIPLTNYAGWFLTGLVMMALLWRPFATASAPRIDDRLPTTLWLWTAIGSFVAHAVFLGLPGSAVAGGLGMGAVAVAFVRALRRA